MHLLFTNELLPFSLKQYTEATCSNLQQERSDRNRVCVRKWVQDQNQWDTPHWQESTLSQGQNSVWYEKTFCSVIAWTYLEETLSLKKNVKNVCMYKHDSCTGTKKYSIISCYFGAFSRIQPHVCSDEPTETWNCRQQSSERDNVGVCTERNCPGQGICHRLSWSKQR